MEDFDEDPLDLFDDDGDGVAEMCLLFDEDKKGGHGNKPSSNSGCCVTLLMFGGTASVMTWGITKILS